MKFFFKSFLFVILLISIIQKTYAQCFQIESILADACDTAPGGIDEGFNEMVRFKVGATAINTSNMSVNWPANSWTGLIQNATTTTKVDQLNAQITAAGGCGQIIQPTGGVLPANAKVVLVTSQNFNVALNYFGAITENIYILFQNNPTQTNGHFGNYNATPAARTLIINFGTCFDSVTYQRSLLININGTFGGGSALENGATVNFTPSGTATYVNNGCVAPVEVSTIDAGNATANACQGSTINLSGVAQNLQIGSQTTWSASSGTFSDVNSLTSSYTLNSATTGSVTLTLSGINKCGVTISDSIIVNINNSITPDFVLPSSICAGSAVPTLNGTSPNGVIGTWSPNSVSSSSTNTYIFTPTINTCANSFPYTITVTNSITPDFATTLNLCSGQTAPNLDFTSPNGIVGSWTPNTISNTVSGNYVFTPNTNQCASSITKVVTINAIITPDFATTLNLCSGQNTPNLDLTSPNGIVGTWLPNVISNTASGSYIFTPTSNPCAGSITKVVTINAIITPDFATTLNLCSGQNTPN
ncbi:MAG: hypothetical protein H7174_13645, partial [Flavobacterium sp.]|nr:hypothetical protein [Flavobacterium sp.]